MPEYLAPGVYVEETSFRSKSIEGVATSTTGFAGMCRFGPVQFTGGPASSEPRLITSFTEFERVYGSLEALSVSAPGVRDRTNYLAHAARAFFANGGQRLYVSRVYTPPSAGGTGVASASVPAGDLSATWTARWPGEEGNALVQVAVRRSKNIAFNHPDLGIQAQRARAGAVVEITAANAAADGNDPLVPGDLAVVEVDADGRQSFHGEAGPVAPAAGEVIQLVELTVTVTTASGRVDVHDELGAHPDQRRYIGKILEQHDPEDENAAVWFDWSPEDTNLADPLDRFLPATLMIALQGNTDLRLTGGRDGDVPAATDLAGSAADPDDSAVKATGLHALGEIDDIAIVALPDSGAYPTMDECAAAADALITHAEQDRYRIAVLDGPLGSSLNEIREFRGRFDSKYGALYYPWIEILDPTERAAQGAPPRRILLPPSGAVTGIYARNDVERGVHKAPANEVVRGLTRFELNINKGRNDVLNPEGINALRFFDGRGFRVWGARTISSDPEWKYVNVRRLFVFIEHSIDKGTQWAVFEPNGDRLWANVRQTIESFLHTLWRDGMLLGRTPEEAFFVRCDRTTMTQNDLDNGRLICLIGVAPVKPAEFVIFRIGQFTADAQS